MSARVQPMERPAHQKKCFEHFSYGMLGVSFWFTGHPTPESNALPETPNMYHFVTRTKTEYSLSWITAHRLWPSLLSWVMGSDSTLDLWVPPQKLNKSNQNKSNQLTAPTNIKEPLTPGISKKDWTQLLKNSYWLVFSFS